MHKQRVCLFVQFLFYEWSCKGNLYTPCIIIWPPDNTFSHLSHTLVVVDNITLKVAETKSWFKSRLPFVTRITSPGILRCDRASNVFIHKLFNYAVYNYRVYKDCVLEMERNLEEDHVFATLLACRNRGKPQTKEARSQHLRFMNSRRYVTISAAGVILQTCVLRSQT
jgi:hypothetical protein